MAAAEFDRNLFVLPNDMPFCGLDCSTEFEGLSEKERLYAYYLSQASWYGGLVVYHQTSPESPLVFLLLHKLFKHQKLDELKRVALEKAGLTEDDFKAVLVYAAGVFSNSGNYKGYGNSKFVPNVEKSKFESLIHQSRAYETEKETIDFLLANVLEKIFSLDKRERRLGYADQGVTTYYSQNVTKQDTEKVDLYMKAKKIEPWNTRLFKDIDAKTGKTLYEIRLASIEQGEVSPPEEFEDFLVTITKGDYGPLLARVNHFLALAKEHAANSNQVGMLEKYMEHFKTGALDLHKDGTRFWIKDVGPAVESYIGFIVKYRDPAGSRAEFLSFVTMMNRATSETFARLVDKADEFLALLPWDRSYEKDTFIRPDFTSLDVLAFASSGIPAGMNIPNYIEIRTNEGFKNVCFSNVVSTKPLTKMTFLADGDDFVYCAASEIHVGLHELLGHGSGKLFIRNKDGTFNFDIDKVKDLESGQKITSWYDEGEIYSTKFGALCSAYEECCADAVSYYLCTFPEVIKIFGHTDEKLIDEIKYVNLLNRFQAGLYGLEHYSSDRKAWGQAHCHARFVLLMVGLEAGEGFLQIKEIKNEEDGKPDLLFTLERSKIESVGKPAIGKFLKKLQLFKCTGDIAKATALFDHYSKMTPDILHWRDIVIARRTPRPIVVLANTVMRHNHVSLIKYPETPDGAVQSYIERYSDSKIEGDMMELWKKNRANFSK